MLKIAIKCSYKIISAKWDNLYISHCVSGIYIQLLLPSVTVRSSFASLIAVLNSAASVEKRNTTGIVTSSISFPSPDIANMGDVAALESAILSNTIPASAPAF